MSLLMTVQLGVEEPERTAPLFEASLAEFLGGLAVIVLVSVVSWMIRQRRREVRRYTLLNSVDADGNPVLHVTTRRAGTVVRRDVGRGPERFELTSTSLGDGTYVAEPIDRYV